MNLGSGLLIQGLKEGKTTARGQTACGDQDEHTIAIEVVPCDKETIQKLRDQIKDLKSQFHETVDQIKRLRNNPEYVRAKSEIDRHLTNMGVKALEILVSAAGEKGGSLGDVASILGEIYDITEEGTWEGRWSVKDMLIKNYINLGKRMTIGIISDLVEYGEAGLEFGHDLDVMKATGQALEEPLRRSKELQKQYDDANRRLVDICKDIVGDESKPGKPQSPEPPTLEPQPPAPQPTEPQPPTPQPHTPQPPQPAEPTEPVPTEPPRGQEPPPAPPDDEDIIIEPPLPPVTPPPGGGGGFPIECGCDRWDQSGWSSNPEGLGRIGQDIGSLVPCLNEFNQKTVRPMEIANDTTSLLFERMEQAMMLPEAQKVQAFRGFLPLMSDLRARYTQFVNEFKSMSDSLNQCRPAIERAGEIIGATGPETGR